MIWEPYETMGKIRNNVQSGNLNYLPLGAKDLTWQTAKLIGLANRTFIIPGPDVGGIPVPPIPTFRL